MLENIFSTLDDFRNLPNYQLERRTDIFFAVYLKDLMEIKTNEKISDVIIPEFPLKRGIVHKDFKPLLSYKIDYVLFNETYDKMYLLELKTDTHSRRLSQDEYLIKAKEVGFKVMVEGLKEIFGATSSKRKYFYLFEKICKTGLVEMNGELKDCIFDAHKSTQSISEMIKNIQLFAKQPSIEVFYIQPKGDDKEVINFDYIANFLKRYEDDFSKRFSEYLLKWVEPV